MTLVAARIDASDSRVFDLATQCVRAASGGDDLEKELAADLFGRLDAMVYFQSPNQVKQAREKLNKLRIDLEGNDFAEPIPDEFAAVDQYLEIAKNAHLPGTVRSYAIQATAEAIEGLSKRQVEVAIEGGNVEGADERTEKLRLALAECSKDIAAADFLKLKPSIDQWQADSESLSKSVALASGRDAKHTEESERKVDALLERGITHAHQLQPHIDNGLEAALALQKSVEQHLTSLKRLENWLYNRRILDRIAELGESSLSCQEQLKKLSDVKDEQLSEYVLSRFEAAWATNMDGLESDDGRVEATKMRILKTEWKE